MFINIGILIHRPCPLWCKIELAVAIKGRKEGFYNNNNKRRKFYLIFKAKPYAANCGFVDSRGWS
jgi:hypothetical protein